MRLRQISQPLSIMYSKKALKNRAFLFVPEVGLEPVCLHQTGRPTRVKTDEFELCQKNLLAGNFSDLIFLNILFPEAVLSCFL